jgi:hypothetical protein
MGFSEDHGVVRRIDRPTRQIFLEDGRSYVVVRGIDLAKFEAGEHVAVRIEDENGKPVVIKMIKGDRFPATPLQTQRSRPF